MFRNNLTTGTGGYFRKGSIPWNRGIKGYMGANKTSFKKGNIPPNYKCLDTFIIILGSVFFNDFQLNLIK